MNTDQKQRKIVEDAPIMQSMMMAPSAAYTPIIPRASPLAKKAAPIVSHDTQTTPTDDAWSQDVERLMMPVPAIYVLERTHAVIPNATPQQVAERISSCLQRESIAAFFDEYEALIDAETSDGIQFSVRLWWNAEKQVLVEVQKASGCCYSYCQAAKSILRAAKGVTSLKKRTFSIPPRIREQAEDDCERQLREGFTIAANLLKEEGMDSHLMALESLVHLSRTSQNSVLAARLCLGEDFQSTLVSLIESRRIGATEQVTEMEKDNSNLMHRLALTALANSFSALEVAGELRTFLMANPALMAPSLSSAMVRDVAQAAKQPHDSCEAVRCLRFLMVHTPEPEKFQAAAAAREAVAVAHAEGARRHSSLEEETRALRRQL